MARYNREFLVPYLQDICALHLVQRELNNRIDKTKGTIWNYNRGYTAGKPPECKYYKNDAGCIGLLFGLVGGFMFVVGIVSLIGIFMGECPAPVFFGLGSFVAIALGAMILYYEFTDYADTERKNKVSQELYEIEKQEYEERVQCCQQKTAEGKARIPALQQKISFYEGELKRISGLLEQLYGANVIARQYRGLYPAVFLYDWFSTSGADDLDNALNMFVLEQIKAKLDQIIENQAEIILNQRMIMANQHQALAEQRSHNAYMREKACQISASMEEQERYLSMIEGNTAANAYFTAAAYLKD